MADDIKLVIDVDDRSVIKSIKNQEKLEKEIMDTAKGLKRLKDALATGMISQSRFDKGTAQVNSRISHLTKTLYSGAGAIDQWATHVNQAKNKTNRFGMVAQQVGYQVGDFFVQVQSGTSALVAFGQQGTQLAGLLPGVAGAVIGIGLSLGTMLLKTFLDTRDAGKQLEESVKAVEEALSDLSNVSSMLRDTLGAPFSEANTVLREYLELLEKSSAANVQKQVSLAFGAKGESTGILNELALMAEDMTEPPWWAGKKFGGSKKEIEDANELLKVRGEIAEILRGTAAQPRVIEGAEGLRKLGDDLLAYSKKFNGTLGERIRTLMFESGLTKLMVDDEKAKGDAANDALEEHATEMEAFYDMIAKEDEDEAKRKSDLMKKLWEALYKNRMEAKRAKEEEAEANKKKQDAIDKEKSSMESKIYLQNTINGNFGDEVLLSEVKKQMARESYRQSRLALGISEDIVLKEMEQYDILQDLLEANKDLTKEMDKQLAINSAMVYSGRGGDPRKFDSNNPMGWLTPEVLALYKEFTSEQNKKGAKPTTMEGPIKALERQIELSKALFGLEGDARREQEIFMQLQFQNRDADKKAKEGDLRDLAEKVAKQEELTKVFEEQRQAQKDLADTIANSMGDALTSIVDGTKSVKDAFKDMARAIIAELYQIYVVKQITGMISGAIMGPAAAGGYFGPAGGVGGGSGATIAYADGGVVGSPTTFGMNDGRTGLMGEAGPEAIMPLKRGKNGKLGVQAEGGSGGDVIIHQNFNFTANGDESVKKIIAQQAPAIANMTKKSILDDRRRGGQMKQAFG